MIPPMAAPTPVPTFAPVEKELLVLCACDVDVDFDVDFVAGETIELDAGVDIVPVAEVDVGLVVDSCRAGTLGVEEVIATDDAP